MTEKEAESAARFIGIFHEDAWHDQVTSSTGARSWAVKAVTDGEYTWFNSKADVIGFIKDKIFGGEE